MPYKDPLKQRAYMRDWMRERRNQWLVGKVCVSCGSTQRLELHHRDSHEKVSHRIFSWSMPRFEKEVQKCDVLCFDCHKQQTEANLEGPYRYSRQLVQHVAYLAKEGMSHRAIATHTGISKTHVGSILRGERRAGIV